MRHNIIFHIDNPKQDLNNISFLQIFSFVIEFFLESCPHLIPIVFKFESKVLFPNINEFSYLIDGNLKNSICISSILRFLGLSTSMLLLWEKVFDISILLVHERIYFVHCLIETNHWTRNISAFFYVFPRIYHAIDLVF